MKLFLLLVLAAMASATIVCETCMIQDMIYCRRNQHAYCLPKGSTCPSTFTQINTVQQCPNVVDPRLPYVNLGSLRKPLVDITINQVVIPHVFCTEPATASENAYIVFGYTAARNATERVHLSWNADVGSPIDPGIPFKFVTTSTIKPTHVAEVPPSADSVTYRLGDMDAKVNIYQLANHPRCSDLCNFNDCASCAGANSSAISCFWCLSDETCRPVLAPGNTNCTVPVYTPDDCDLPVGGPNDTCTTMTNCTACAETDGCQWCDSNCECQTIGGNDTCYQNLIITNSAQCDVEGNPSTYCRTISDLTALRALYASTNGASWTNNSGWTGSDICTFYGVDCAAHTLNLSNNNLVGTLPKEFGCLSVFKTINVSNNKLVGKLPWTIGRLTGVQHFDAQNNDLTGAIPHTIGLANGLQFLYLHGNTLACDIPDELADLTFIQELHVNDNALEGVLTPNYLNLQYAFELHFEDNCNIQEPYPGFIVALRNSRPRTPVVPDLNNSAARCI